MMEFETIMMLKNMSLGMALGALFTIILGLWFDIVLEN